MFGIVSIAAQEAAEDSIPEPKLVTVDKTHFLVARRHLRFRRKGPRYDRGKVGGGRDTPIGCCRSGIDEPVNR